MSQTYFTILTKHGAELLANATALGTPLKLTSMAVGDGNGSVPKPIATQTALIHEVRRAAINSLSVDENNPNQIIAEQVIPENEGGWFIHEVGLFDDNNNLIAVGNCPPTYKPQLAEGSGRTQVIRMIIVIDNIDSIALKIDPSIVLATREYVDKKVKGFITLNDFSGLLNENGYQKLPNGLIIQWGKTNSIQIKGEVIPPITFPHRVLSVHFSDTNSEQATSNTSISWRCDSTTVNRLSWIANEPPGLFSFFAIGF